jgi:anti-sigma regulatory factor (Ser/Thr protein kinase)
MTLNQSFNADTLHTLRAAVLAEAAAAGMLRDEASQVMLAVHELAANSVVHGAGTGQLWMDTVAGQLVCNVSDAGAAHAGGDGRPSGAWQVEAGHGLWLVHQLADHVSVVAGPDGSRATAVFGLPSQRGESSNGTAVDARRAPQRPVCAAERWRARRERRADVTG